MNAEIEHASMPLTTTVEVGRSVVMSIQSSCVTDAATVTAVGNAGDAVRQALRGRHSESG